jgi:hypothetical protein
MEGSSKGFSAVHVASDNQTVPTMTGVAAGMSVARWTHA